MIIPLLYFSGICAGVLWAVDANGYYLPFYFFCTLNFATQLSDYCSCTLLSSTLKIKIKSQLNSCLVIPEKTELRMWKKEGDWIPWGRIYPGHCSGLCYCCYSKQQLVRL